MRTFGDSITAGLNANPASSSWVNLFTPVNHAVSASQAADMADVVQNTVPLKNETYTIMVGTNDIYKYKTDTLKQGYFKQFLRHCIAWLSFPNKVTAQSPNITYTGSWWNVGVNSFGKACSTNGNTATAAVEGNKVFIGFIIQDNVLTFGTADVEIDGIVVGSFACNGTGMTTVLNKTYASAAVCFDVPSGQHTVKVTVTSPSGKYFYLNYIAGNNQESPKVLVSNILKWSASGYSSNGLSPSITNDYNNLINIVSSEFSNSVLVDNYSHIDPAIHLSSDGVHPNNAGHAIIYARFNDEIGR